MLHRTAPCRPALCWLALCLALAACDKNAAAPDAGTTATASPNTTPTNAASTATPSAAATPAAPDLPGLGALEKELRAGIPQGSGDYARALALATLHQRGKLPYDELERATVALRLPPHPLGDAYLMIPVPPPPSPDDFDPKMMPRDWQGTWGEVAMAYWLGVLDKPLYRKLHQAAHPSCKR